MLTLGINAYHGDSSACIFRDGLLLGAVEEERFNRVKHWAGFPIESIKYCLEIANCNITDINFIAINQNSKAHLVKKLYYLLSNRVNLNFLLSRYVNKKNRININSTLCRNFKVNDINAEIVYIEHHLAHLYSTHSLSPFNDSIGLSVDGFGDFCSTAWGVCVGKNIKVEGRVFFPHSLGIFYQAITQYLGFKNYGDEYKVMGLAPYGEEKYITEMNKIINIENDGMFSLNLDFFIHQNSSIQFEWHDGTPNYTNLYTDRLISLLGPERSIYDKLEQHHKDIARSAQSTYEKVLFHMLNNLHAKYGIDNLTLSGGCALNSVANGKIRANTGFKNIFIQPAAGDSGGAIGAALAVITKNKNLNNEIKNISAYLGPSYTDDEIKLLIQQKSSELIKNGCEFNEYDFENIKKIVAESIANGNVVGWFQDRMEWGSRALGNRSILADPRRHDIKDILNTKIKRRESFRPFAPSIMREHVFEWFKNDCDVPYMTQVIEIKEEKRRIIPAVTHVDGTGRLQTVTKENNLKYYELINEFYKLTGVPILLNTSFNENEPIVCTPTEAYNCFNRTKMDILVLGLWVIKRN